MDLQECLARKDSGQIYFPEPELVDAQQKVLELQYDFNATRPAEQEKRQQLLKQMFAEIGEGCYIEPPLHANWAGQNVHFGKNVYANFNLTLVDDTHVYIGDNVMFGPNVTITAAGHPVDPDLRRQVYQYNFPVRIEENVWVGAGVIILPGVTIGKNSVIGAGSVVTKDIPANVVAMGVPCRVVREIGPRDKEFYFRDYRTEDGLQ